MAESNYKVGRGTEDHARYWPFKHTKKWTKIIFMYSKTLNVSAHSPFINTTYWLAAYLYIYIIESTTSGKFNKLKQAFTFSKLMINIDHDIFSVFNFFSVYLWSLSFIDHVKSCAPHRHTHIYILGRQSFQPFI